MSLIWYIYSNDAVSGPFSTENVEQGLTQNKWSMQSLIWWKGQREWVSVDTWRTDLKNILHNFRTNIQTTAWYVEHLGTQKGPMYSKDLHSFIQVNGIAGSCRVWTDGMETWKSVYEITELVQFFGITRRKHARAPIKANITVQTNAIEEVSAHAGSISAGGLGVRGLSSVKQGDSISVLLKSPLLIREVKAEAKIVYTTEGGVTGIEFMNLPKESASIISDYVSQFE